VLSKNNFSPVSDNRRFCFVLPPPFLYTHLQL
jgi:hypothetical protein